MGRQPEHRAGHNDRQPRSKHAAACPSNATTCTVPRCTPGEHRTATRALHGQRGHALHKRHAGSVVGCWWPSAAYIHSQGVAVLAENEIVVQATCTQKSCKVSDLAQKDKAGPTPTIRWLGKTQQHACNLCASRALARLATGVAHNFRNQSIGIQCRIPPKRKKTHQKMPAAEISDRGGAQRMHQHPSSTIK